MSRDVDPEETAALAVLAELGRLPGSEDTRVTSAEDEVEDVLRRLDLEAVGLLAYALDPVAPAAATRETLLARLSGDSTQEVTPTGEELPDFDLEPIEFPSDTEAEPPAPPPVAPPAAPARAAEAPAARRPEAPRPPAPAPVRPAPGVSVPVRGREAAARRRRSIAGPIAALFACAALALGGWALWLSSELAAGRGQVARLERELGQAQQAHAAERAAFAERVAALERRAAFASGPATLVFALRPPAGSPQPLARGKLWVASDHQHWQLDVVGLDPPPPGHEYQIWFLVDGYPFNGGCFSLEKGKVGGRFDTRMPAGTQAVSLTVERAGGAPRPTSTVVLLADSAVEL